MAELTHAEVVASVARDAGQQADNTCRCPQYRVLVVDDEPSIREVTSEALSEEGYEVLTAEDGQEALELLPKFRPHLVVTDLKMPRLSGFELLEIMRGRFPGLPVIAVSGGFSGDQPPNVIADAFFAKGAAYIAPLAAKISELLSTAGASSHLPTGGDSRSIQAD